MVHHFFKLITPLSILLSGATKKDLEELSKTRKFLGEEFEIIKKLEVKHSPRRVPILFDRSNQKTLNELVFFDDELDHEFRYPYPSYYQASKRMTTQSRDKRSTFKPSPIYGQKRFGRMTKFPSAWHRMYDRNKIKRSLLLHAVQSENTHIHSSADHLEKRRTKLMSKAMKTLVLTRIM